MRTDYIGKDMMSHVLYALTTENRLACMVALETGLRIDDVLSLRSNCLNKRSFTITEQKTHKRRSVRLSAALRAELREIAGEPYIFAGRINKESHRTRQAVYKDLKRAAKCFRLNINLAPHSLRKLYAVDLYQRTGDLERVKAALNHDDIAVTLLYAIADELTARKKRGRG